MKKLLFACVAVLVSTSACMTELRQEGLEWSPAADGDSSLCTTGALGQAINSTGPVPKGCLKIEGGDIGKVPQTLTFSGLSVTINSWRAKDDGGDYIGFSFSSSGAVAYAVKAGTETFASTGTTWVHPAGTGGPAAKGISNITFCPGGGDGGTGLPEGPGNGGPCTPGGGGSTDGGSIPEGGGGAGSPCSSNSQCSSGMCTEGKCAPGGQGTPCKVGTDCQSKICASNVCTDPNGKPGGSPCSANSECYSGSCANQTCEGGGQGAPCRQDADCKQGNICTNGSCNPQIN